MNQENNVPVPITELEATQLELVVSEKTIGSLTTNAKEIRELVKSALPRYDISNYSSDDIAKAKADKALLNKAMKTLNDKRIEFEKEFMAPFSEFKQVVTDTCGLIKDAVGKIDTVIKADEERTKSEKREQIEHLAETCGLEELGVKLDTIFNEKWLNKTTTMKKVEEEMRQRIATITSEMETLKSFSEDYDVLIVRYKENLDLQETVRYANQLKQQREATKANEEHKPEPEYKPEPQQAEVLVEGQKEPFATSQVPAEEENHHDIDQSEADAADAFADIMGQSAGAPKPASYPRYYEIYANDERFKELEAFMDNLGITYSLKD